ncbi:hypothetical protein MHTCC0001_00240 [Flavobacteriaceae bacterium MHTCC 0001]
MGSLVKKEVVGEVRYELHKIGEKGKLTQRGRFVAAALGSIPWIGGAIAASSAMHAEKEQGKINTLQTIWLEEHQRKIEELYRTIHQIQERLDTSTKGVSERMESEAYLTLVRKGFKEWDNAQTFEKKEYIRKLLTNACAANSTTDDLIRLFMDWIKTYHETHFLIIQEIYKHPGITRGEIWENLNGVYAREDSMEADLYKLLIRDLSTGGIIRQHRAINYDGTFIKSRQKRSKSKTLVSAFDTTKQYELTELGKKFVHYTMEEVLTKLDNE